MLTDEKGMITLQEKDRVPRQIWIASVDLNPLTDGPPREFSAPKVGLCIAYVFIDYIVAD